ncbi:MAG: hypothetical protein K8T20_07775 [Planctomycetes bacterium]|nr:hypothetical protein [Planctomycetota bacterium]
MRHAATIALLAAAVLLSACGKKESDSNSSSSSSSGSSSTASDNPSGLDASKDLSADLKKLMESAYGWSASDQARLKALIKTFALPGQEAWFKKTFGDEIGGQRASKYAEMMPKMEEGVMGFIEGAHKENQTAVTVVHLTDPADPEAKGAQSEALKSMKAPVALYTVYFKVPGEPLGKSLWSFVYADGAFRLMGK